MLKSRQLEYISLESTWMCYEKILRVKYVDSSLFLIATDVELITIKLMDKWFTIRSLLVLHCPAFVCYTEMPGVSIIEFFMFKLYNHSLHLQKLFLYK